MAMMNGRSMGEGDKMSVGQVKHRFIQAVQSKKVDRAINLALLKFNQFHALVLAIDNNLAVLADALVTLGWDVNEVRFMDGSTPLHAAVTVGNLQLINKLIENGAIVGKRDASGNTPLGKFLKTRHVRFDNGIFRVLVSCMTKAEIISKNEHGETLLHNAAKNRFVPITIFETLMDIGIDVRAWDDFTGRNFIMDMMIFYTDELLVKRVWEKAFTVGIDVNDRDNFGCTVLHRIASEERSSLLDWVADRKDIEIRVRNDNNQTPMWLACKRGNIGMVRVLYKMGETFHNSAYSRWSGGQSPFDIASTNGHVELALTLKHQAKDRQVNGLREVRSLKESAKIAIREGLAERGTNIWPGVQQLGLPRQLVSYLVELC